jgi:hypothetical protein
MPLDESKIVPLPDQSYSTASATVKELQEVEKAFADFAIAYAKKCGKYQAPPPGLTPPPAGFFPHGVATVKRGTFMRMPPGPSSATEATLDFPGKATGPVTIVETSEPLVLIKPDASSSVKGRLYPMKSDSHLMVFGDVVTIQGKISLPGKHIVIVARELHTQALGSEGAELNVDGTAPPAAPIPQPQAVDGDPGSAGELHATDHVFLTYNAKWPTPGNPGVDASNGRDGAPGNAAGDIYIFCHSLPQHFSLKLSAAGGAGQGGQPGQPGGPGGPGGKGAALHIGKVGKNQGVFVTLGKVGGPGGLGGLGGVGGKGGDAGNCVFVLNKELPAVTAQWAVNPGAGGARGGRGANGPTGATGWSPSQNRADYHGLVVNVVDGGPPPFLPKTDSRTERPDPPNAKWGRRLFTYEADVASVPEGADHPVNELRGPAPMSYLRKLLETARLRYLEWDAFRFAKDPRTDGIKAELLDRLDYLLAALRLVPKVMADSDRELRTGMHDMVVALIDRAGKNLDYFGNLHDVVPLGSPKFYLETFKNSLDLLEKREKMFHAYATALAEQKTVAQETVGALQSIDEEASTLEKEQSTLTTVLFTMVRHDIPQAHGDAMVARRELLPVLQKLEAWVDTCFGLTPNDFLECVFNLAFVGSPFEANPQAKRPQTVLSKHGLFTAATTITSQTGNLINKALTTLPNDEGQPVNRQHLLRRIDRFTGSLGNLKEAWWTVQRSRHYPADPDMIQLDDPDAYRLLVAQKDFDQLLEQFANHKEAKSAMETMDKYVAAVQKRNDVIADYNALVSDYLRASGDLRALAGQKSAAENARAASAKPDLAYETAYVTSLYNRTREECVKSCYLASRAHRFWTLKPETAFYKALRLGTPNEMNYLVLSAAAEQLCSDRDSEIVGAFAKMVQYFPDLPNDYDGSGRYLRLYPATYPASFEDLRTKGIATFSLQPRIIKPLDENPFADYPNVRLRRVRVWIEGLEARPSKPEQSEVHVGIKHLGQDCILGENGEIFTFTHEPVHTSMVYDWTEVVWDNKKHVANPRQALLQEGHDGTLTIPSEYEGSAYPPLIGPFATWEISLLNSVHVNWSKISAIHLDFHGFFQNL